ILGGAARVGGPILGGVIFYVAFRFLDVIIDQMEKNNWVPDSVVNSIQAGLVRFMFLGIALMLLMVFRPQGILGNKRELELGDH
ncbi:MAG: branched-chain amino acid ABC transporter permease, partial [Acidimicrobiales bacterium]